MVTTFYRSRATLTIWIFCLRFNTQNMWTGIKNIVLGNNFLLEQIYFYYLITISACKNDNHFFRRDKQKELIDSWRQNKLKRQRALRYLKSVWFGDTLQLSLSVCNCVCLYVCQGILLNGSIDSKIFYRYYRFLFF